MPKLHRLPTRPKASLIHAVVETPRGSRAKLAYDPELRVVKYDRALTLGLKYPYDWGFVPSTLADDGDPLDVMILHDASLSPGVVVVCRPIGVLEIVQTGSRGKERNDRIFAVPIETGHRPLWTSVLQIPRGLREELEIFFKTSEVLIEKKLKILGWGDEKAAQKAIDRLAV